MPFQTTEVLPDLNLEGTSQTLVYRLNTGEVRTGFYNGRWRFSDATFAQIDPGLIKYWIEAEELLWRVEPQPLGLTL